MTVRTWIELFLPWSIDQTKWNCGKLSKCIRRRYLGVISKGKLYFCPHKISSKSRQGRAVCLVEISSSQCFDKEKIPPKKIHVPGSLGIAITSYSPWLNPREQDTGAMGQAPWRRRWRSSHDVFDLEPGSVPNKREMKYHACTRPRCRFKIPAK